MQPLLHDGHQHVHGNGNPDLSLYGVLACSVKILDPEMLFDPFEEQFHPPATFVELSNDEGRKGKIVGQKNKNLVCFGIVIFDAAKLVRVIFFGVKVFLGASTGNMVVDNKKVLEKLFYQQRCFQNKESVETLTYEVLKDICCLRVQ